MVECIICPCHLTSRWAEINPLILKNKTCTIFLYYFSDINITLQLLETVIWIFTLHFKPIALRKTKTAYSFGLSECNRVNKEKACKQNKLVHFQGKQLCHVHFCLLTFGQLLKEKQLRPFWQILSLRVMLTFGRALLFREVNRKSPSCSP